MNVLHILDHSLPIHSGYSFRSAEILSAQESMGLRVRVLTGPKHYLEPTQDSEVNGIRYERAPYRSDWLARLPVVQQLEVIRILRARIGQIIRESSIDIIHAHSPSLNGLAALSAPRRGSIPVVYEMRASWEDAAVDHGTTTRGSVRYRLTRGLETTAMQRADAVTTICEGLKDDICARDIPDSKVTVIPNAVDVDRFQPRPELRPELREKYGVGDDLVAAFCGSFYAYEGLDLLLRAVADVESRIPGISVLLAGGGDQEASLKSLASNLGIDSKVRFLGRLPQSSVIELYGLADVCVFPRYRNKLTEMVTPLKPLEAMAAGAVVLASDVGGHRELIQDRQTGFLFEADSAEDLARGLESIANQNQVKDVGSAAREFVCKERTWPASVSRYREVYRQAIEKRQGGR